MPEVDWSKLHQEQESIDKSVKEIKQGGSGGNSRTKDTTNTISQPQEAPANIFGYQQGTADNPITKDTQPSTTAQQRASQAVQDTQIRATMPVATATIPRTSHLSLRSQPQEQAKQITGTYTEYKPKPVGDTLLGIIPLPNFEYSIKDKPLIPLIAGAISPTFLPGVLLMSKEYKQPIAQTRSYFEEKAGAAQIEAQRKGQFGLSAKELLYQVPTQGLLFMEKPAETTSTLVALGLTGGESAGIKAEGKGFISGVKEVGKGLIEVTIPNMIIGQKIKESQEGKTGGEIAGQLVVFGGAGLAAYGISKINVKEPKIDYGTIQKGEITFKQFNEDIIQKKVELSPKVTTGRGTIEGKPVKLTSVQFTKGDIPIEATRITFEEGGKIQTQKYPSFTAGEVYNKAGKKTSDIFYYNELPKVSEANIKQTNLGQKRDILSWIRKEPEDFSGSLVRGSQDIRFTEKTGTKLETKSVLNNVPYSETTISQVNRNAKFEVADYFKGKKVTDINPMFEEVKSSEAGFVQPKIDFTKEFKLVKGKYTIGEKQEVVTARLREKINIGREEKIDITNIGRGRIGKAEPGEKPIDITSGGRYKNLQDTIMKENIKRKSLFEEKINKAETSQAYKLKQEGKAEVIGLKTEELTSMIKPSATTISIPKTVTKTTILIPRTSFNPVRSTETKKSKTLQPVVESKAAQKGEQSFNIQSITSKPSQETSQPSKIQPITAQEVRQGFKVKQDLKIAQTSDIIRTPENINIPFKPVGKPKPNIIPTEIGTPFILPPFGGGGLDLTGSEGRGKGIKTSKYGYAPSVEAQLFNIHGTKGKGYGSGLTVRPIAKYDSKATKVFMGSMFE